MKFYLPTQALIAALVTLAPSAWAETITADTEYQYDSADWATDSYFKFDAAVTHYTYTSSPAKEYTLSYSIQF